jgi:organic hydroperoxide reductase OsmC/OhrA
MTVFKDYTFRVSAVPRRHGIVRVITGDKPPLEVATPVEFRNGLPGYWSPEDMLVAATASCYALTFRAVAHRRGVPFDDLEVTGKGHVTRRADGRFGFTLVELHVSVAADLERAEAVTDIAHAAERACIVGRALEIPVELELDVRTHAPALPAAAAESGATT